MRGDFSAWNKDGSRNFRGTLHQQGRVLIDRDWNAQTEINLEWQRAAGRDAFGAGVAAVPAALPEGFKVTGAVLAGGKVKVSVSKGRVWADGLLAESRKDIADRVATYLNLPPAALPDPNAAPRDAVILESWLEELNPFQAPALLIEPALGGVDTTERVQTAFRFRLYRMDAGETCDSLIPKLQDDFTAKGKLTARLDPFTDSGGDCPVAESGGYTGFEHRLYRVEIAETEKPGAWFKWSQSNGGLVGTGDFDAAARKVALHGNLNAIAHSGASAFYLEALDLDDASGYWRVVYAAKASLGPDNALSLPAPADPDVFLGSIPPAPAVGKRFFRLWNGIEPVADYAAAEKELPDLAGIKLKFDTGAAEKFKPSDYWTFEVRASGIGNPEVLIGDPATFEGFPPQGVHYHRVPLAELMWSSAGADIEDCRRVFQPLTKLKTCCTYRVGDGIHSHGDFIRIQDAINALPKSEGGEVCILPGLYRENLVLEGPHNRNVILKGCGERTILRAVTDAPVIRVRYGRNIRIESLAVEAHDDGVGILLEGEEKTAGNGNRDRYLESISLSGLSVSAAGRSALRAYVAQFLTLEDSAFRIRDARSREPAVYLAGDDMLVDRCEIRVITEGLSKLGEEYSNDLDRLFPALGASGGLQIGGGSERVRILGNLIVSGTRNGITLGSIDLIRDGVLTRGHGPVRRRRVPGAEDCCTPDDGVVDDGDETEDGSVPVAGPPLEDILIQGNRIFNMGRNGIGVAAFFGLGAKADPKDVAAMEKATAKGMVSVARLVIRENRIERCMNSIQREIPEKLGALMGYGGISLADAEALVIEDNSILGNGPDFLEPICGIFVLKGAGIEITRNRILDNGARNGKEATAKTVKRGPRGGIHIALAQSPGPGALSGSRRAGSPYAGVPALKVHDNVVTVPMGRSLTVIAQGPVSAVGNRFTSFGIPPVDFRSLLLAVAADKSLKAEVMWELLNLIAGNVFILDQGRLALVPAADSGYGNIQSGTAAKAYEAGARPAAAQAGRPQDRRFAAGTVLFADNQCHQDLATPESSFAVSSIFIASLDDVGFHANQCDCDLDGDFLLANAVIFGMTSRTSDNRFRESLARAMFSAATFGIQNVTTDNESIHCLLVLGIAYLNRHNLVLAEIATIKGDVTKAVGAHPCDAALKLFKNFGGD